MSHLPHAVGVSSAVPATAHRISLLRCCWCVRLIPVLVRRLRYLEDELVDLPYDDVADESVPDRPEDVRPFVYKVREDDEDGVSSKDEVSHAHPDTPASTSAVLFCCLFLCCHRLQHADLSIDLRPHNLLPLVGFTGSLVSAPLSPCLTCSGADAHVDDSAVLCYWPGHHRNRV